MHIGLIGGIGPAATEFYYRGLVKAHISAGKRMELTIVHAQVVDLIRNAGQGAKQEQAEIYQEYATRLQAAGADAVAVTSLGGHFCIQEFEAMSPLPVINAIPALNTYLKCAKLKRVGLLGTRFVMETGVYGGISGIDFILPQGDDLDAVHDSYLAIATTGFASDEQRALMFSAGKDICETRGAETVLLAGTDLFLAFDGYDCGFPVIDCAEVHIEALARASMEST